MCGRAAPSSWVAGSRQGRVPRMRRRNAWVCARSGELVRAGKKADLFGRHNRVVNRIPDLSTARANYGTLYEDMKCGLWELGKGEMQTCLLRNVEDRMLPCPDKFWI